ncbi:hypothetical protein [Natronorubrum sp. A-ect3]|uniref:hypothetical protein n=1 Tax=Natronorubrum sp. A-ect3 TaxID=3242698 RepID=UPI00359DD058
MPIPVSRVLEKLKRFYYQQSIQDIEDAIDQLEHGWCPRLLSFFHGGPVNGWPRVSVDEHIANLQDVKQRREAWIAEAKGGT